MSATEFQRVSTHDSLQNQMKNVIIAMILFKSEFQRVSTSFNASCNAVKTLICVVFCLLFGSFNAQSFNESQRESQRGSWIDPWIDPFVGVGRGWVAGGGDRQTDRQAFVAVRPPSNAPRDEIGRGSPPPLRFTSIIVQKSIKSPKMCHIHQHVIFVHS